MKYVTKQFEIEAVQFTGDNWGEVRQFVGLRPDDPFNFRYDGFDDVNNWWIDPPEGIVAVVWDYLQKTLVGVRVNDYIIKGMKGEFYPCAPEVFNAKYKEKQ